MTRSSRPVDGHAELVEPYRNATRTLLRPLELATDASPDLGNASSQSRRANDRSKCSSTSETSPPATTKRIRTKIRTLSASSCNVPTTIARHPLLSPLPPRNRRRFLLFAKSLRPYPSLQPSLASSNLLRVNLCRLNILWSHRRVHRLLSHHSRRSRRPRARSSPLVRSYLCRRGRTVYPQEEVEEERLTWEWGPTSMPSFSRSMPSPWEGLGRTTCSRLSTIVAATMRG